MKKLKIQNLNKQIICIIIILMLCNFIIPNYSYAVSANGGGSLLKVIAQFLCFIPDAVINFLQEMFISTDEIDDTATGEYKILYSPGVIFSGEIPAFDINFINPKGEFKESVNLVEDAIVIGGGTKELDITKSEIDSYYGGNAYEVMNQLIKDEDGRFIRTDGKVLKLKGDKFITDGSNQHDEAAVITLKELLENLNIDWVNDSYAMAEGGIEFDGTLEEAENIKINLESQSQEVFLYNVKYEGENYQELSVKYDIDEGVAETRDHNFSYRIKAEYAQVSKTNPYKLINEYSHLKITTEKESELETKTYKYTSSILQPIIATWYKTLRRIALVGLLSVLLYVGIKILLSSTSAQDKAKYKNMLKDWLVALCLLFALHYIMNVTIIVVNKINDVVKVSSIGASGEDILMSTVRNDIANGDNWSVVLSYVVIYCVLMVYTVIFTIQYIRRTIYLAFLTTIAPLVTLTYPLDKIKDGKAQAFDMWLKDYVFFTLVQVVHLLLYYIFLGSAINLADKGSWVYAIVAIGFLTPAEKIMKKMFGFEKSKSMGAMAAGATGALVMNLMNQISHKPPRVPRKYKWRKCEGSKNSI